MRRLAADLISLHEQLHEKIDKGTTLTEAEDDSLLEHPLFRATELVAERTGYPPLDVQEFAERVGTPFGLSYRKGRKGSLERDGKSDKRDLHFMLPKIRELDVHELLEELEPSHPGIAETLGINKLKQPAKPTGKPQRRAATVNERMAGTIMENPEAMGWNSPQWAKHLKCGKSSVVETATWKKLESARLQAKAERMKDRRRKPKASDSRRD